MIKGLYDKGGGQHDYSHLSSPYVVGIGKQNNFTYHFLNGKAINLDGIHSKSSSKSHLKS